MVLWNILMTMHFLLEEVTSMKVKSREQDSLQLQGVGLRYRSFGLDLSYLINMSKINSALDNTLSFRSNSGTSEKKHPTTIVNKSNNFYKKASYIFVWRLFFMSIVNGEFASLVNFLHQAFTIHFGFVNSQSSICFACQFFLLQPFTIPFAKQKIHF